MMIKFLRSKQLGRKKWAKKLPALFCFLLALTGCHGNDHQSTYIISDISEQQAVDSEDPKL
jgi:hypothetical protein